MNALIMIAMILCFVFQSSFCKMFADACPKGEKQSMPVFTIMFGLSVGVISWAIGGFQMTAHPYTVLLGALNAISLFLYNLAMIRAGQRGSYSFMMICMLVGGTVCPMFHEVLFLDGVLSILQIIGIILMCIAFVVMNLKGLTLKGSNLQYLLWCLILFVSNGAYTIINNLQQTLTDHADRSVMLLFSYTGSAFLAFIYHLITRKKETFSDYQVGKKAAGWLTVSCASAAIAANLLFVMLARMDATILYTIINGGIIVGSVIYAFFVFKERPSKSQLIGILISVVSIVLLSI